MNFQMLQMFGAGTACVVAPVSRILYKNRITKEYENLHIPTMETKKNIMMRFYNTINDVMVREIKKLELHI